MDFKDYFNYPLCSDYAKRLKSVTSDFDVRRFNAVIGDQLLDLEMKDRVKLMAEGVWKGLGMPYPVAVDAVCEAIAGNSRFSPMRSFPVWIASQIVEQYGLDDFDTSMSAIYQITQQFTGEFAIRPILDRYPEATFDRLKVWACDDSVDVRRLVSEGSRPRLPWAMRISHLLENPEPVFELLAMLKNDTEKYVRRSVANNINDISKDHPDRVVKELKAWKAQVNDNEANKELHWVIRHGSRSLLKHCHEGALSLLGYNSNIQCDVVEFFVAPDTIKSGGEVELNCQIETFNTTSEKVMIDYVLQSPGKLGGINRKVFKWSNRTVNKAKKIVLRKTISLKSNSVRNYYPGEYDVQLIVNGKKAATYLFYVTD